MKLPTYQKCREAVYADKATALQQFINLYEPDGGENFRYNMRALLEPYEFRIAELEKTLQTYIGLANVVDSFVYLTPEHCLYESVRQDVLGYLKQIKERR